MLPTILRKAHEFSRLLVVRVILIALLAVVSIALAKIFGALIPDGISYTVGAEAVDRILDIIANSMLAVTTFSLTVMAATHRSVSGLWTPRAHQILLQDTTTHTVLATFVGAYLYALIAIILRETQVFEGEELFVLFVMTVAVALLVVVAIIRWIGHLEMFGSLIETGTRIEQSTQDAWNLRASWPALGGHALESVPEDATAVHAHETGYLQQIYQDRLQDVAKDADARIWITAHVGDFVHRGQVIARTDVSDDALRDRIRENLSIGALRNYAQDPEFGLLCLSEIGTRALSPGVNDPGTAIDMLRRVARIVLSGPDTRGGGDVRHDRLYLPEFDIDRALRRAIAPLMRDGAALFEVQNAIREALQAMVLHADADLSAAAKGLLAEADISAREKLTSEEAARLTSS